MQMKRDTALNRSGRVSFSNFRPFLIGSTNRVAPLVLCTSTVARRFCVATLPLIRYSTTNQPGWENEKRTRNVPTERPFKSVVTSEFRRNPSIKLPKDSPFELNGLRSNST